jgi:hypothetical protein
MTGGNYSPEKKKDKENREEMMPIEEGNGSI